MNNMCTKLNNDLELITNNNMVENPGNSCGSSVVSDCDSGGPSDHHQIFDFDTEAADWAQMSTFENQLDPLVQYLQDGHDCDSELNGNKKPEELCVDNCTETYKRALNNANDSNQRHLAVLGFEQVCRLNDVMNETISIHGHGNFPTLKICLKDLVRVVRRKLETDTASGGAAVRVRGIRLNGGAASHVLAADPQPYNDLDLIFSVDLLSNRDFECVKFAVLSSLYEMLPEGMNCNRASIYSLKEAYVSKMVKVIENSDGGDRWSLFSFGHSRGKGVELKFVDCMRRQFEFSVDSFQILLDSLFTFYECSNVKFSEYFFPTIIGESVYGDFREALYHLQSKLIATKYPEEIRGGGLLKYCNLLVKHYVPASQGDIKILQRYMCSRFFIDFPDIGQQKRKLKNYLWNHFVDPDEEDLKHQYLMVLHDVVQESTVCLMGHERRQTLQLIRNIAWEELYQHPASSVLKHPVTLVYGNEILYPTLDTNCEYTACNNGWFPYRS